jgi:hypothetical protein
MRQNPNSCRLVITTSVVAVCIGSTLILAAVIFLAIAPIRARRIFAKAESLQIGKSTFPQAEKVATQFDGGSVGPCSPAECEWYFGTSNFALPGWWSGEGEAFVVRLHVKDGLVDRKVLIYWIGAGSTMSAVIVTEKL